MTAAEKQSTADRNRKYLEKRRAAGDVAVATFVEKDFAARLDDIRGERSRAAYTRRALKLVMAFDEQNEEVSADQAFFDFMTKGGAAAHR